MSRIQRWASDVVQACCGSDSPPPNPSSEPAGERSIELQDDEAWGRLLPPDWGTDLRFAVGGPITYSSKKELYQRLCAGVFLDDGEQAYWLDAATGSVCRAVGARGLDISWGDDPRYWAWAPSEAGSSRFQEVAYLREVCWFFVKGQIHLRLPPGTYTVSARIAFAQNWLGWDEHMVSLSMSTLDGQRVASLGYLQQPKGGGGAHEREVIKLRKADDYWLECDIGQFTFPAEQLGVEMDVCISETTSNQWKTGLFLDGVVIRPSFLIQEAQ